MKKSCLGQLLLVLVSTLLIGSPCFASYPDKPIRFITGVTPGAPLDLMMRTLAKYLSDELGQAITVGNRVGGTGAISMQAVLIVPDDG